MAERKWAVGDRVAMGIDPAMVGEIAELKDEGMVEFKPDVRVVELVEGVQETLDYGDETFTFHESSFMSEPADA